MKFITVTKESGDLMWVNTSHIIEFHKFGNSSVLYMTDNVTRVKQTPEQILNQIEND